MSSVKPPATPGRIEIVTTDEQSRGRYANSMIVTHSSEEFILDWLLNSPTGAHLVARIVVSPGHVRRIIDALAENLARYESRFGPVRAPGPADQSFN